MKKLKVTKGAAAGDKAVAIGGFLVMLLAGFFGAEPDVAMQVDASAMMMTRDMNGAGMERGQVCAVIFPDSGSRRHAACPE